MVELRIDLPYSRWDYKLSGVYRISFSGGRFYIGSSENLRSRASQWESALNNPGKVYRKYELSADLIEHIKLRQNAVFEILELCSTNDVREREDEYLYKYKDDINMLSRPECSWKPILQYSRTGNFIKKHVSLSAAARYNSCKTWHIQRVINGERAAWHNMVFIYEHQYEDRRKTIVKSRYTFNLPKKNKSIKIEQYDNNWNKIAVYDTYPQASKAVGVNQRSIQRAIAGLQKSAAGFKWALVKEGVILTNNQESFNE